MKHSKYFPSLELQKTVISPWITLNESNLLHWILNLVNKLCWLTISGSFNLTRIFRGPVTSTITFEGAWGRPEVSNPNFNFLRPLKRFCHKFRCFSHSFKWAGVNWPPPTIVADLMSWPNFSTWSLLWLIRVAKWWIIDSGDVNRVPSIALPMVSSKSEIKWKSVKSNRKVKR